MRSAHRRHRPDLRPKPASGPPVEVTIETVGGEGDGVAPGPVFAPFTLPGERVLVAGSGERRDLVEVLAASAERVIPPCPHFGACGGCALQHWDHAPYLAWKVERLRGTLAKQRIETEILAPLRRRARHPPAPGAARAAGEPPGSAPGLQGAQVLGPGGHHRLPHRRPPACRPRSRR